MEDTYPILKIGKTCFLTGDLTYIAATILLLVMYHKKVIPMLKWLCHTFWEKKSSYIIKLIVSGLIVSAIAIIKPFRLSAQHNVCRNIVMIELVLFIVYVICLYKQRNFRNEQAVKPLLQLFIIHSVTELLLNLLIEADEVIFHTDKCSAVIWAIWCMLAGMAAQFIRINYFQTKNSSPPKIEIYPERKIELQSVMDELNRTIESGPVFVLLKGKQGLGKRTFTSFMADSLHNNNRKVIQVDVNVSSRKNSREIKEFFQKELKIQMKEEKLYVDGLKDLIMEYVEKIKIVSEAIGNKLLKNMMQPETIASLLSDKDSVQSVPDIITHCLTSEFVFVRFSGITKNVAEHALEAIREIKETLHYPRCVITVVCDTEELQNIPEGVNFDEDFAWKIDLKPLNYNKLFSYNQKGDNTAWNITGCQCIHIADEYETFKNNMDKDLSITISKKDTDRKIIEKKFEKCKAALDNSLKYPKKNAKLCKSLQRDISRLNQIMKTYSVEEKKEYLIQYDCIQNLLLLNVIQTMRPSIYSKICEDGFLNYIDNGEWENTDDEIIYGLLYLYKGKRSPRLDRKKQFLIKFIEGDMDMLYEKSRHTLRHYQEMLGKKDYANIDIADMIVKYIRWRADGNQDQENLICELFTKVLPWQIEHSQKNVQSAYELLYLVFKKYELDNLLTPDIPFWAGFKNFMIKKKWQLYNMSYVNDLHLFLVKTYVPLTFQYFIELFQYNNIESCMEVHGEIIGTSSINGKKFKEAITLFVSAYTTSFPNIENCSDSLKILEKMVSYCCEKLKESGIAEDFPCIRLAKLQINELIDFEKVLNHILAPQIERFTHQLDIQSLTKAIYAILDECKDYSAVVKGQIENAVEQIIGSYDMKVQRKEDIRSLQEALNKLKVAMNSDLNEIEILIMKNLVNSDHSSPDISE